MAEIIVVHGYAGAGKTTQCERVAAEGLQDIEVQHVSAGNRLREIRTGEVHSIYSDIINARNAPTPLPDEVVLGAMLEVVQTPESSEPLVLMDGYPRHPEAVDLFDRTLKSHAHTFLGTAALHIPLNISVERILARGIRPGENLHGAATLQEYAKARYANESRTTNVAIDALSRIAPVEIVDANGNVGDVHKRFVQALEKFLASPSQQSGILD